MKDTIAEALLLTAKNDGLHGECAFKLCRVCGNVRLWSRGVDEKLPLKVVWSFADEMCSECQEVATRAPEVFALIRRALRFESVYQDYRKNCTDSELEKPTLV